MAAKKTTLMIDDGLYADVRRRAAERGESVSAIVSEAIRGYLAGSTQPRKVIDLPISNAKMEFPEWLDLSSNVAVFDYLDQGLPIERLR